MTGTNSSQCEIYEHGNPYLYTKENFLKDMQLLQNRYPLSHNLASSQETQSLGLENRLILYPVGCTVCSATGTSRFDVSLVKACNSIIFPKNYWGDDVCSWQCILLFAYNNSFDPITTQEKVPEGMC